MGRIKVKVRKKEKPSGLEFRDAEPEESWGIGAEEDLVMIDDVWEPEPSFPDGPLKEKFYLDQESISLSDGHAGKDVYYDPDTREVVKKFWVMREQFQDPETGKIRCFTRNEEEHHPIPPEISTTWELWKYLLNH